MEYQYRPRTNRVFKYSVQKLIELVKLRPVIWDSTRADFRSFSRKEKAWKEIYEALDDNYRSSDEKVQADIGTRITAKWKHIRDAFKRSFKKRVHHTKVKKYMYHDRLDFMHKLLNADGVVLSPQRRNSTNSESTTEPFTEGSTSYDDGITNEPLVGHIKIEPEKQLTEYIETTAQNLKVEIDDELPMYRNEEYSNLKRKAVDFEDEIIASRTSKVQRVEMGTEIQPIEREEHPKSQSSCESATSQVKNVANILSPTPDEDESFFSSILSMVRDMTEDEKLEFRMSVLHLIRETRLRRRMCSSMNH